MKSRSCVILEDLRLSLTKKSKTGRSQNFVYHVTFTFLQMIRAGHFFLQKINDFFRWQISTGKKTSFLSTLEATNILSTKAFSGFSNSNIISVLAFEKIIVSYHIIPETAPNSDFIQTKRQFVKIFNCSRTDVVKVRQNDDQQVWVLLSQWNRLRKTAWFLQKHGVFSCSLGYSRDVFRWLDITTYQKEVVYYWASIQIL